MEIWKDVKGYEGIYSVSNTSKIRSEERISPIGRKLKGKEMKQRVSNDGYVRMKLYKNSKQSTYYLHRLIMIAFLGDSELDVNHIDGDKTNNSLSNLEYLTRSENHKHAFRMGLRKITESQKDKIRGNLNSTHKKQMKKVFDSKIKKTFESIKQAAEFYGVSQGGFKKWIRKKEHIKVLTK